MSRTDTSELIREQILQLILTHSSNPRLQIDAYYINYITWLVNVENDIIKLVNFRNNLRIEIDKIATERIPMKRRTRILHAALGGEVEFLNNDEYAYENPNFTEAALALDFCSNKSVIHRNTPLMAAASNGHNEFVYKMIEKYGNKLNFFYKPQAADELSGYSGTHLVKDNLITLLVAKGYINNTFDGQRFDERYSFLNILKLIKKTIGDEEFSKLINEKEEMFGNSPLHISCARRDHDAIKFMLESGADPLQANNEGKLAQEMLNLNYDQSYSLARSLVAFHLIDKRSFEDEAKLENSRILIQAALHKKISQSLEGGNPRGVVSADSLQHITKIKAQEEDAVTMIADHMKMEENPAMPGIGILSAYHRSLASQNSKPLPDKAYKGIGLDAELVTLSGMPALKINGIFSPDLERFCIAGSAQKIKQVDIEQAFKNGHIVAYYNDAGKKVALPNDLSEVAKIFHGVGNIKFTVRDKDGGEKDYSCDRNNKTVFVTKDCPEAKLAIGVEKKGEQFDPRKHGITALDNHRAIIAEAENAMGRPRG